METKRRLSPPIALLLGVATALTLAVPASAPQAVATPPAADTAVAPVAGRSAGATVSKSWEKKIHRLTNKKRAKHGCRKLRANKALRRAARRHSKRMAAANSLNHQLPGEASLGDRISRAGYRNWRGIAENVAYGYASPRSTVKAWMRSPGHRRNILNCSYRHLGVGVVIKGGVPWSTQDFGHK